MHAHESIALPYAGAVRDATDPTSTLRAEAWHGLLRVQRDVARACDAALVRTHQLGLSAFDVLYAVGQAADGVLEMRALVRDALLSQSQVSRTVATLVGLGLLERHGAGRSVFVSITSAGRESLAAAGRTQYDTLAAVLFEPLTEQDVGHLTQLLHRIQGGARYPSPAHHEPLRRRSAPVPDGG